MTSITRFLTLQNAYSNPSTPSSSSTATIITPNTTPAPSPSSAVTTALVAARAATPSHCAVFAIKWDKIRKDGRRTDMQWRIRNKRSLSNGVSWVYKYGAELEDQEGKYWLCQRCHEKGDYKSQLFVSDLTSSIIEHLRIIYGIRKAGSEQAENTSPIDDYIKLIIPFQETRWKEIFTD